MSNSAGKNEKKHRIIIIDIERQWVIHYHYFFMNGYLIKDLSATQKADTVNIIIADVSIRHCK